MNIQLRYSPNTGLILSQLVPEIGSLLQVSERVVPAKVFYHVTGTQTLNCLRNQALWCILEADFRPRLTSKRIWS